ncbi:hypothetical protein ONA70_05790 [Micromonospora yasonensis]|uniref:hypothetical protein n=1 Tax=Micromonospora yasonensis TaxID=1128667 RepID=UPI0022323DF2|nr:hypothetical protein [Micromonospora yasonensis]MCW3839604.1 hypothetical protein [Micromonospora yasonensis]
MAIAYAGPTRPEDQAATVDRTGSGAHGPLKLAVAYLAGTYLVFLLFGQSAQVPDLAVLTMFVSGGIGALALGYGLNVRYGARLRPRPASRVAGQPRVLIAVCATYYLAFSLFLLSVRGFPTPGSLLTAFTSPGDSYFDRIRDTTDSMPPLVHLFTLTSVCYTMLIPLAVLWWRSMGHLLRLYVVAGLMAYATFFLSVGTLKGLGDMLIFWAASYLAVRSRHGVGRRSSRKRRSGILLALVVGLLFTGYMSFNQSDRLQHAGAADIFPPNPVVARVVGDQLASGVSATVFYPTHGYLGLAYNLETPFRWTYGLGGSKAMSELYQRVTGDDGPARDRYTARTEALTGWPDGIYWSTIYPWLASDLTYPGSLIFMVVVGWFLAKFWREARQGRTLSLMLLAQLALFVTFIPANNQIGQQSFALIGFASLALLSVLNRIHRGLDAADPPDPPR